MNPYALRLLLLAVAASLVAQPASKAADSRNPALVERFRRVALPQFADALGWRHSMYYSTIQTADIDGDGQSELLARWVDGLHVYRFSNGTLLRHSRLEALSDEGGFTEPSWHRTIQTAVLDPGLGQADVIARKGDGIHVYRYHRATQGWRELGAGVGSRPFADSGENALKNFQRPDHYLSIRAADVTKDGAAELMGRESDGIVMYRWDARAESWTAMRSSVVPAAYQAARSRPFDSHTIQLVDVDKDGTAELLIHNDGGTQTHKWTESGWSPVPSANGPLSGVAGSADAAYNGPGKAVVDASGTAWLHGVVPGPSGRGSGLLQLHQWKEGRWQLSRSIELPGTGWERASQSGTAMAADVQGDAAPEFLIRGPEGLHAFHADGRALANMSQSFNDAQGWNLPQHYSTIRTFPVRLMEDGASVTRVFVLGRGKSGIELYRYDPSSPGVSAARSGKSASTAAGGRSAAWTTATTNFDDFCTQPSSGTCASYTAFSQQANRDNDLRSHYGEDADSSANWLASIALTSRPASASPADFDAVRQKLETELRYLHTVHVWFGNNAKAVNYGYSQSANTLQDVYEKVSLQSGGGGTSASLVLKWAGFALEMVSELSTAFGQAEVSIVAGILSGILDATADATENTDGGEEVRKTYGELSQQMNDQQNDFVAANAAAKLAYLTSWAKLQQIGADSQTAGYEWAKENPVELAEAQSRASRGIKRFVYKPLASAAWKIWACQPHVWPFGGCYASSQYDWRFNCTYRTTYTDPNPWDNIAYVVNRDHSYPRFDALMEITGTGPQDLNMSNYLYLLGGNLDWDLETPDGNLWLQPGQDPGTIGFPDMQQGCFGGGSTTALPVARTVQDNPIRAVTRSLSAGTATLTTDAGSLAQRLTAAQVNPYRITAAEVGPLLDALRSLRDDSIAAADGQVRRRLVSPLREAMSSIRKVRNPPPPEQSLGQRQRSVSASPAARLVQSYISRVQGSSSVLGESTANLLATRAHRLLAQLHGQEP